MMVVDPNQQQLEFPQLPTSYLRLAAHQVAQHYSLHSMFLSDNNLSNSSGSRIIVCKTSECRLPLIRLADMLVNLPPEDSGVVKVAIKQRPHKKSQTFSNSNSNSSKKNNSRSAEERKEEYNWACAQIFSSSNSSGGSGKLEIEPKFPDTSLHGSSGVLRLDEKSSFMGYLM